jgi:MFS family permease
VGSDVKEIVMTTANARPADAADQAPARALTRGTLVAASLAVLVGQVALAIPAVLNGLFQADLVPSSSQLTWISDAFLVPVTLLELTFGVFGDLFGRKRLLVGGALVLALGEGVAVLTPGTGSSTGSRVAVLWAGQILAGIGAAALFPTSLAMIAAGTHTVRRRSNAIAIWAAALSVGGALSPVLGGLVAGKHYGSDPNAGWRWAFIAVLLIAVASAVVSLLLARNSSSPQGRSLDWPGQATIAVALFALLFAVIQGPTSGWGSTQVVAGFVIAAVALIAFVRVESRTRSPLLRLDLFRNQAFAVASVVTVLAMFAFLGTAYSVSIRLTTVQDFTPLRASVAFVLLNGMALIQAPLTSRLMSRYNPRWLLAAGAGLMAVGDIWLSTVSIEHRTIAGLAVPLVLIGIGFALAVSSVTAVAVNTVPNGLEGMASGSTSLLRDFGFTLGPAVIGAIALSRAANDIAEKVKASPALQQALSSFYGSLAHTPPAQRASVGAAIGAVRSGSPLAQNGPPATVTVDVGGQLHTVAFNPLKSVAYHALGSAYSIGFLVCGIAAALAALLAVVALRGRANDPMISAESLITV